MLVLQVLRVVQASMALARQLQAKLCKIGVLTRLTLHTKIESIMQTNAPPVMTKPAKHRSNALTFWHGRFRDCCCWRRWDRRSRHRRSCSSMSASTSVRLGVPSMVVEVTR